MKLIKAHAPAVAQDRASPFQMKQTQPPKGLVNFTMPDATEGRSGDQMVAPVMSSIGNLTPMSQPSPTNGGGEIYRDHAGLKGGVLVIMLRYVTTNPGGPGCRNPPQHMP